MSSSQCTCDCDGVVSLFTPHMAQYGTVWDSMGPHPRLTPGSWCPTPDTSRHHHSSTHVTRRHWRGIAWCRVFSCSVLWQSSWCAEHLLQEISISPFLKASLYFLVLVLLPSPKCSSSVKTSEPEWSHPSPWLPKCVFTRAPGTGHNYPEVPSSDTF